MQEGLGSRIQWPADWDPASACVGRLYMRIPDPAPLRNAKEQSGVAKRPIQASPCITQVLISLRHISTIGRKSSKKMLVETGHLSTPVYFSAAQRSRKLHLAHSKGALIWLVMRCPAVPSLAIHRLFAFLVGQGLKQLKQPPKIAKGKE